MRVLDALIIVKDPDGSYEAFEFDSAEPIRLDPAYVNELAQAAASAMGIVIDLDEAAAAAGTPALAVAA